MRIEFMPGCWGLPFGLSVRERGWVFSIGPIHVVSHAYFKEGQGDG